MSQSPLNSGSPSVLVDASIYIFQYYFSLPDHWFSKKESWPTAAVYGYTAFLVRLLEQQRPQRIAACFDESLATCFRNKIYPDYKSSRALPDEALAFQLKACRRASDLLGIKTYGSATHEADDLLGSLYQPLTRTAKPIAILTRDKDLAQLLRRPQDFLWDYSAKSTAKSSDSAAATQIGIQHFASDIQTKFGVEAKQLIDYLALVGDSIDDIPGVPGIGAKTAQVLLNHFGSIDELLRCRHTLVDLPLRGAKSLAAKLIEYQEQIRVAQQLATIVTDLKLISSVNELQWQQPHWSALKRFCSQMGFPKLYQRILILEDS